MGIWRPDCARVKTARRGGCRARLTLACLHIHIHYLPRIRAGIPGTQLAHSKQHPPHTPGSACISLWHMQMHAQVRVHAHRLQPHLWSSATAIHAPSTTSTRTESDARRRRVGRRHRHIRPRRCRRWCNRCRRCRTCSLLLLRRSRRSACPCSQPCCCMPAVRPALARCGQRLLCGQCLLSGQRLLRGTHAGAQAGRPVLPPVVLPAVRRAPAVLRHAAVLPAFAAAARYQPNRLAAPGLLPLLLPAAAHLSQVVLLVVPPKDCRSTLVPRRRRACCCPRH